MSEQNPFEAPRSELVRPRTPGEALLEKKIASRMLVLRARGGQTFGLFLRWSATPYLISIVYFGAVLAFLFFLAIFPLFYLMLGMCLGMYIRDYAWVRRARKSWPFTVKVTDWDLVREIAGE